MSEACQKAGECVLNATLAATGAKNKGIVQRSDLTGFNFAEVPTILIEMGFLSNLDEDALIFDAFPPHYGNKSGAKPKLLEIIFGTP